MANRYVAIYKADWSAAPDTTAVLFDGWDDDTAGTLYVEIVEGADPDGNPSQQGPNYDASYTSMSAMEAAEDGDYAGGVNVKTYGNARNDGGLANTDAYIFAPTNNDPSLWIDNDYSADCFLSITFDGVQFSRASGNEDLVNIRASSRQKQIEFINCRFFHTTNANGLYQNNNDTTNQQIRYKNCIFGTSTGYDVLDYAVDCNLFYVYNCTLVCTDANKNGIDLNSANGAAIVNCAIANQDDDLQGSGAAVANYCATDQGAGEGSNGINISATWDSTCFVNEATDLNIQDVDSPLYHSGYNQTADSEIPATDIVGTTRPTGANPVSIGAFEFPEAAPTDLVITDGGADHLQVPDTPTLSQLFAITVAGADHLQVPDALVLGQLHNLTVAGADHLQVSDNIALDQAHSLTVAGADHLQVPDNVALDQSHDITVAGADHLQVADAVVLGQTHNLSVQDVDHLQVADNIALNQVHDITVAGADHLQVADNIALIVPLIVAGADHLQIPDNITLGQIHNLVVAGADHLQVADNVTLGQLHSLIVAETFHLQVSEALTLSGIDGISVAEAAHLQVADNITLGQVHNLDVAEATHLQVADTLYFGLDLAIAGADHLQVSDNITLGQLHNLVVAGVDHLQVADNITLGQLHNLNTAGADHLQVADNIALDQTHDITVAGADHLQIADNVALSQFFSITVAGADHLQVADSTVLGQLHNLNTAGADHLQVSDNITLRQANTLLIAGADHLQAADAIVLSQLAILTVAGVDHLQVADTLVVVPGIVCAESVHLQVADALGIFGGEFNLGIVQDGAWHLQTADNIVLAIQSGFVTTIVDPTIHSKTVQRSIINLDVEEPLNRHFKHIGIYRAMVSLTTEREITYYDN